MSFPRNWYGRLSFPLASPCYCRLFALSANRISVFHSPCWLLKLRACARRWLSEFGGKYCCRLVAEANSSTQPVNILLIVVWERGGGSVRMIPAQVWVARNMSVLTSLFIVCVLLKFECQFDVCQSKEHLISGDWAGSRSLLICDYSSCATHFRNT